MTFKSASIQIGAPTEMPLVNIYALLLILLGRSEHLGPYSDPVTDQLTGLMSLSAPPQLCTSHTFEKRKTSTKVGSLSTALAIETLQSITSTKS